MTLRTKRRTADDRDARNRRNAPSYRRGRCLPRRCTRRRDPAPARLRRPAHPGRRGERLPAVRPSSARPGRADRRGHRRHPAAGRARPRRRAVAGHDAGRARPQEPQGTHGLPRRHPPAVRCPDPGLRRTGHRDRCRGAAARRAAEWPPGRLRPPYLRGLPRAARRPPRRPPGRRRRRRIRRLRDRVGVPGRGLDVTVVEAGPARWRGCSVRPWGGSWPRCTATTARS